MYTVKTLLSCISIPPPPSHFTPLSLKFQVHLETLQQQQASGANVLSAGAGPSGSSDTLGGSQQQELMNVSTNQQVFTVDTGTGNCDTSGMPTLADASLAETASRLQQVSASSPFAKPGPI